MSSNPVLDRYEITLGISRPMLLRLRHLAFYLLLAYAASLTVPLVFSSTSTGIDPSWYFATNYLPGSHYKYGPDIIFTHGPLGFVYWPENVGWNLPIAFAIRLLIWALLMREMAIAYHRSRTAPVLCFLAVLSIVVAQPGLSYLFDQMLASTALLMIVRDDPETQKFWHTTFPFSILIVIAFLAKETGYIMLIYAFAAYFFVAYWPQRRKPSRDSLLRCGWVVTTPFIAYLVYNPSVTGLWAYVKGATNIVSGYSAAMSFPRPLGDYLGLGVFVSLLLGFAVYAGYRKWLGIETIACVMVPLFVITKYSFVQHGPLFFYGFGLVLFAIPVLKCPRVKAATIAASATWAVLCILSLVGTNRAWKALSIERWNPAPHLRDISSLLHWKQTIAIMAAQTDANLLADTLPDSLLARIQRAPVVIFPWELAYGPANHLNLIPLYTLQSYSAYTNWLDRATADHLTRTPRDTRLLVEWKSIEGRHPLLDVPATWGAIYNCFEGELATPGLLLLKKTEHPAAFNFRPVRHTMSDIHEWQNVPDREHAVSVSVSFSPTLVGIARGLLYRINPVYMELETDRNELMQFRIVPDVLRHPFVINCLPLDQSGLESLVFGHVCQQKIKRFRFWGDGLDSFSSSTEIAFAEAPDARLRFTTENVPGPESGASDVRFGSAFLLRGAHFSPSSMQMELFWQSLAEQPLKYIVFVHLIDQNGNMLAQADHEQVPGAQTASRTAKAGENWRDVVQLSRNQLKGVTRIALGIWVPPGNFLMADSGDRDWGNRRLILPVPKELSRLVEPSTEPLALVTAPPVGGSASAVFGDELSLTGYSIGNKGGTGVELHWKALRKLSADYIVFVHALDRKGGIAFQFDHVLKNASGSATSSWAEGETVADQFAADPPRNCAPGTYALRIGLYVRKPFKIIPLTQTTFQRLGDDWKNQAVLLTNVECKFR